MATVVLLSGPAGAGKTTVARRLEGEGFLRLSMDEAAWATGYRGVGFPPRDVLVVLEDELRERMTAAVAADRDVVVDMSLTTREIRDAWRRSVEATGATCELWSIEAPVDVLWERVRMREPGDPNAFRMTRAELGAYVDSVEPPHPDERARTVRTG
jgi:predicted kinase